MALTLEKLGRREYAVIALDHALELDPDFPGVVLEKANILGDVGRDEEAVGIYGHEAERRPDEPIIYFNRGISLARLGRKEEALRDFNKALKLDEGSDGPEQQSILLSLGRYAEALGVSRRY
jgi:tetratricopeptide (TPR) repeat protein